MLELFKTAVELCLDMPELSIATPDSAEMKKKFQTWASIVIPNRAFASKLVSLLLKQVFPPKVMKAKSLTNKFEKMWSCYHHFICSDDMCSVWLQGLSNPPVNRHFKLFTQAVTKWLMKEVVNSAIPPMPTVTSVQGASAVLSIQDEQALRYVAGYAVMKLKKYLKMKGSPQAITFFECLAATHEEEEKADEDITYLQYSKTWVEKVNRGGLFTVNDNTYLLFQAMELSVRKTLSIEWISREPTLHIKEEMKRTALNDPAVMSCWSTVLAAVTDMECDRSDDLLEEIVEKWISVRSHSFASGWIEQHQLSVRKNTLQARSLRKELAKSKN